ncbi:MAG: hypothetical protein WBO69_11450 [Thermoanaerobaculia bacterium]
MSRTIERPGPEGRSGPLVKQTGGYLHLWMPYLVLVLLHLLSGLQMEQPLILADEVGYLGNARYLAGTAHMPNMQDTQFYHFGYSLLVLPAFWLFSGPVAIYKAAIAINALLISSLYVLIYMILTTVFDAQKKAAIWIAFACCLYPALTLYSNFAWSENAFVPLLALTTLLFAQYLGSGSTRDALLFGCAVGFLYTIHPRALPVVLLVVIYLLVLAAFKVLARGRVFLSVTAIGLLLALTRIVNDHLKSVGWVGAGEFSIAELAGRLLPGSAFPVLAQRSLGQVLYLSLASHGLFVVGFAAAILYVRRELASGTSRRVLADPKVGARIFMLIAASGVFLASLTVRAFSTYGPEGMQGAGFIPGRYNESFAVLFIALALAETWEKSIKTPQTLRRAALVAGVLLGLAALVTAQISDFLQILDSDVPPEAARRSISAVQVDAVDVPGVFPIVHFIGELNLYIVALVASASFLAITLTMRYSRRAGLVLLMLLFASFSFYNYRHKLMPSRDRAKPRLSFAEQSSHLGPIPSISFDNAHFDPGMLYGSQYLLQHVRFNLFDSRKGEEPASEVVISGTRWGDSGHPDAQLVLQEGNGDFALWVLPGEVQSRLPPANYLTATLGAAPAFRVQESGFYAQEWLQGAPARWTNGAAKLRVPLDPAHMPRDLEIDTVAFNRDEVQLQVVANGVELWNQSIPAEGWSGSFELEQVPLHDELLIELNSDTFTPSEGPSGPVTQRHLGVIVKGIRLKTLVKSGEPGG